MATAISFPRAPLVTPRACTPRRLVHVSAARASPPRGGGRVGRRSPTVPAVAGASSSGLAPDTSVPAWDALGGVSVLAAGTGNAVALTDLWDSAEVPLSSSVICGRSVATQRDGPALACLPCRRMLTPPCACARRGWPWLRC
jgi:hypothetical protein